jgi:dihydrofolate reductase
LSISPPAVRRPGKEHDDAKADLPHGDHPRRRGRRRKRRDGPVRLQGGGVLDRARRPQAPAGSDIILYGGPTAAAAVIDAGLVDEFHLNVHPLIAGRGKKLFANVAERRRLRRRDTTTFSPGLVALKYERA